MKLALQLAFEHRTRWLAMLILTAVSAFVLILCLHDPLGFDIAQKMVGQDSSDPGIGLVLSLATTFLIVQSIAALCLESQARDLAVVKTCGASTRALRLILLGEIFLVASAGFFVGLLCSTVAVDPFVHGSTFSKTEVSIPKVMLDSGIVLKAYIILLVAVTLGAWSTVKRVSRQNVVSALQGESLTTKKRSKVLRIIVAIISGLGMIVLFVLMNFMSVIIDNLRKGNAPKEMLFQVVGVPVLAGILFCMLSLTLLVTVAPNLYQAILQFLMKLLPKSIPAPMQVGVNLARYNAAKYSGSITPIIAFITVVVAVFTVLGAAEKVALQQFQNAGIDTAGMTGTNYESIVYLAGPAILIAVVGSLCTIIMSGRNRIYVNKLTSIIGASHGDRLQQGLFEMGGYIFLAMVLSCIIMLLSAWMVMIGLSGVSGEQQPYMPSWLWWLAAVAASFLFMVAPALFAYIKAKSLPSKSVLETFGE